MRECFDSPCSWIEIRLALIEKAIEKIEILELCNSCFNSISLLIDELT